MTHRPTPTPAELLAAARALLAQAEAMMREPAEAASTSSKPDDATVWRGWVAPTTFTLWPDSGAVGVDHGNGPDAMAWTVLARYHDDPPTWTAPTPSKPKPIGTWGGHTDWIACSGGERPVPADAMVQTVLRCEADNYTATTQPACQWSWFHDDESASDIIAYRLATPAAPPAQEPEPKPAGVLLRGWEWRPRSECWFLLDTDGDARASVGVYGWDCGAPSGPETGLRGKEKAVDRLLADGARWESQQAQWLANDQHTPNAIDCFDAGDVAVMTDGTRRAVAGITQTATLFTDGTWLDDAAAPATIAARIPAADCI